MALKGSPNKNRKKQPKQPITIADIEAIRKMDHEQLYEKLQQTLGKKELDKKQEKSYTIPEVKVYARVPSGFPTWKIVGFLSVLFLLVLI